MKQHPFLPLFRDYTLITIGVILQALSMVLFYIPGNLAAGGVSGIAQLIGNFTGWPVGTLYIVLNVPLLALGWKYLGGRRFLTRTVFAVLGYSIAMDVLTVILPKNGLTSDSILNALYGGVIGGIGVGLVLRGQGTTGGTDILVRLLNIWRGIPYSQTYITTDVFVVIDRRTGVWLGVGAVCRGGFIRGRHRGRVRRRRRAHHAHRVDHHHESAARGPACARRIAARCDDVARAWGCIPVKSGKFCSARSAAPKSIRSRPSCMRPIRKRL